MSQDLQKFMELMETDEALQEKLKTAAESYAGEVTPEATFDNLIAPIAREAGLSFTMEDLQELEKQHTAQQLDLDEMDQVAGGDTTRGTSLAACYKLGIGAGMAVRVKDDGSDYKKATFCFILGFGESSACAYAGASTDSNLPEKWGTNENSFRES